MSPVHLEYFVSAITIQGRGLNEYRAHCELQEQGGENLLLILGTKKVNAVESNRQTFLSLRMWAFLGIAQTLVGFFFLCSVGTV